jgi:Domain of unknown function (DUF4783)
MQKFIFIFLFLGSFLNLATAKSSHITPESATFEQHYGITNIIDAITKALNTGDIATLSQYLAPRVQISIGDQESTYEKDKAAVALQSFFTSKRASGYAPMHSGKSKENADQYMIGNLSTESGKYRVYIYLKTTATGQVIQEIRFDQ